MQSRSQITPLRSVELLTSGVYIKEFDSAGLQICVTSPYGVRAITAKKKKGVIGLWLKRIVVVWPIGRIELSPGWTAVGWIERLKERQINIQPNDLSTRELPSGESTFGRNDQLPRWIVSKHPILRSSGQGVRVSFRVRLACVQTSPISFVARGKGSLFRVQQRK